MKKQLLLAAFFVVALSACNTERDALRLEVERLKSQMDSTSLLNENSAKKMLEIGTLLDSIESAKQQIAVNLEAGTTYDDVSDRLRGVKDYINTTNSKIKDLEKALSSAQSKGSVYAQMVKDLRGKLTEKETLVNDLTAKIEKYKEENDALIKTVDLQNKELADQEALIKKRQEELANLEKKIEGMMTAAKKAEADSYFDQAVKQEEIADKTRLAPGKKKEEYKAAYDLYKKAFEAGRADAFDKMTALEPKMK